MAGGKSNLYRRIEMLTDNEFQMVRASRKSLVLSFAILLTAASGILTSLQLTHAAQEEQVSVKAIDVDEDDTKPAEHSGFVFDADTGEPIVGATVTVTRLESRNWTKLAVSKSKTDETGKYTFTIPPEQLKERLLYILFDIEHPTYAPRHLGSYGYGMIVKNLENGEQPWFSKFKMVQGEKVTGRLLDKDQQPVAGAKVLCNSNPASGNDRVRSSSMETFSGADGRFEVTAVRDGVAGISIVPSDHCMKHINVGAKRGDVGDVTLDSGFAIQGIVKDAKGNPMSNLWVNITPEEGKNEASYKMKRSCKTNEQGEFTTRSLSRGKHLFEVQMKATGALEKLKLANFRDDPTPAMFVNQSINLVEESATKPILLQAVPHVTITTRHFKPDGEISSGHSPYVMGQFDGQHVWLRKGKRTGKGVYELMAPHGLENADLRFMTNEHSALTIQFEGEQPSPRKSYRFERLEEDLDNIRVVRHPAAILKLDIVDESGTQIEDGGIFAHYEFEDEANEQAMMAAQIGWNREEGMFRLSSIVPGSPVSIRFSATGFQTHRRTFTAKEDERRTITIQLKKEEDAKPDVED